MSKRQRTGVTYVTNPFAMPASSSSSRSRQRKVSRGRAKTFSLNARTGGFLGQELKFLDQGKANTVLSQTWAVYDPNDQTPSQHCLNGVAQGDGPSTRDGLRYQAKSLHIKGSLSLAPIVDGNSPRSSHIFRIAVVCDTMTRASQLNATDVFKAAAIGGTAHTGHNVYSFRNLEHTTRFRVLYDKTFVLTPQAAAGSGDGHIESSGVTKAFSINLKIPEKLGAIQCVNAGSDIAGIQNNSFHVIACTDSAAGGTIEYMSRLRFVG
jgi:hypothetical protein